MKRKICLILVGLAVSAGMTWAGTLDQTPADFPTTVNWCQFGCTGAAEGTPSSWVSSGADTGEVSLLSGQNWYNLQQTTSWSGNFSPDMGLVYNGAAYYGVSGADIFLTFDQVEQGAGAYIQSDFYGSYTATITLYNSLYVSLGTYTASGTASGNNDGSAIFLGAFDATADVWAVQFDAFNTSVGCEDQGDCYEPDFAIGTAGMYYPATTTPEPASMLLIAPALLGLAAFGRKRILNSRRGNN
jgi:hypothetical protein